MRLRHPRPPPTPWGTNRPIPAATIPPTITAELPEPHAQELDSRETAIAPDPYPPEEEQGEEDEVDLLTREFWPWIKGKWDDINNAIHWYKRNRGEWTRQLKNARAAREAEERTQAKPGDRADRHRPEYEPGGENTERVPVWDSSIHADPDARSLWAAVLADLQLQLPRPTFETWLKPTAGVAFQGDRFIVVAPTPFAAEWLERRIFHTLQSALERAAGRGLQLQLQALEAHSGDEPPVGDDDQVNSSGTKHRITKHRITKHRITKHRITKHRITKHRITKHRITKQEMKPVSEGPVSEGKAARVAGASVTYAAIRYRNAAKAARKRGESPLRDEVARARAGLLLNAAAAWHPLWLKWRASLGETHLPDAPIPPAKSRMGEVFQASKRFGFAVSQGNQSHTLAGQILRAAERLRRKDYTSIPWRKTPATEEVTEEANQEATAPAE